MLYLRAIMRNLGASFFLTLLPLSAWAASYDPILEQIKPGTITITGETHKKVESVELFQNLALDVIKHYQCVVIGLEISNTLFLPDKLSCAVLRGEIGSNAASLPNSNVHH